MTTRETEDFVVPAPVESGLSLVVVAFAAILTAKVSPAVALDKNCCLNPISTLA